MALFSIIIPTFNSGEKLLRTLDSIRAQNFEDVQILVQDGGSTDGTRDFLEKQDDVDWQSAPDDGIYDAMNRGIERARGRYLLFLGAGDILESGVLKEVATSLGDGLGCQFVYGNVRLADGTIYDGEFSSSKLRTKNICQQAIFYNKTLFERLGIFNVRYPLLADWEFNFRCFGDASVQRFFLPVIVTRYEGGGRSTVPDANFLRDRLQLILRHLGGRQFVFALIAKMIPHSLKTRLKGRSA